MSKNTFTFSCPNCKTNLAYDIFHKEIPKEFLVICTSCYFPLLYHTKQARVEISSEKSKKRAFLVHSAKAEDLSLLEWFRGLLRRYGVSSVIVEEDTRVEPDWLTKSLYAIKTTNFTIPFLTKRYQFTDESGLAGWKAPDNCYDEIAISFAKQRDLIALLEKDVDSGNVLQTRAWCYRFERKPTPGAPITADLGFFERLLNYVFSRYEAI